MRCGTTQSSCDGGSSERKAVAAAPGAQRWPSGTTTRRRFVPGQTRRARRSASAGGYRRSWSPSSRRHRPEPSNPCQRAALTGRAQVCLTTRGRITGRILIVAQGARVSRHRPKHSHRHGRACVRAVRSVVRRSGAGGHVGGEDVVGVPVELVAGTVVAHGGAGVSVPGGDLHVA